MDELDFSERSHDADESPAHEPGTGPLTHGMHTVLRCQEPKMEMWKVSFSNTAAPSALVNDLMGLLVPMVPRWYYSCIRVRGTGS